MKTLTNQICNSKNPLILWVKITLIAIYFNCDNIIIVQFEQMLYQNGKQQKGNPMMNFGSYDMGSSDGYNMMSTGSGGWGGGTSMMMGSYGGGMGGYGGQSLGSMMSSFPMGAMKGFGSSMSGSGFGKGSSFMGSSFGLGSIKSKITSLLNGKLGMSMGSGLSGLSGGLLSTMMGLGGW